jgi:hypothetical protein
MNAFARRLLFLLSAVVLLPPMSFGGSARAQFDGMRSAIPTDANMVVLIDAEKLFGSRLADRERWEAKRKAAYAAGVSALAPDASQVMLEV